MEINNKSYKMEDKKRRSSILKPQKPLGDEDLCEMNVENSKNTIRRISFANSNLVKAFVEDEDKNTIWDTTYEEVARYTDSSLEGTTVKSLEKPKNTLNESKIDEPDVVFLNSDMDITPLNIVTDTNTENGALEAFSSNKENINYMVQNSVNVENVSMELTRQFKIIQNNSIHVENVSMEFTERLPIPVACKTVKNFNESLGSCDMEFTKIIASPSPKNCSAKVTAEDTAKTLQNKDVTNNTKEDIWYNLTKCTNETLNISLEDMPCLSYDEENFGTSRPSKSDISKVMCGDYNPSFNSKIMNALPMSFNSDLIPKFLSESAENSLCTTNQNNSPVKESSVFVQPTIIVARPSIMEVTDISNRLEDNVTYPSVHPNVTIFKEIENVNTDDKGFDKKADERKNTVVRKIALLKEKLASHKERMRKRFELLNNEVKELEISCKTVNSSIEVSSADNSAFTDKTENLNEKTSNDSSSKQFLSLKEKVEALASRNGGLWNIISLADNCYKFCTFNDTIIFKVIFDADNGIVNKIEVLNNINEKAEPFAKFIGNLFLEKLKFATVQSALGSEEFDIISLLAYVTVTIDKLLGMCYTYNDLRTDIRYALKMDDTFTVSFHIIRIEPTIHWIISVNMSDVNNITNDSVDVNIAVGNLETSKIKKFVPECQKGFEFLPDFIQKIEQYVNTFA